MNNNNGINDSIDVNKNMETIKNCIGDKKQIIAILYFFSHIVLASVLITCLKKQPIVLTSLLSALLGYIIYSEINEIPYIMLPLIGLVMYIIDFFIMDDFEESQIINNNLNNNIQNKNALITFKKTIWKLPFYGILSYYLIKFINK